MNKWMTYGLLAVFTLIFGGVYLSHPLSSSIPLGYDAGLYKSVVEAYVVSGTDWSALPMWIQRMYPPVVGTVSALIVWVTGVSAEGFGSWLVLWGVVVLEGLLLGAIGWLAFVGAKESREAGVVALGWAVVSFVIYSMYRWGYVKQLLAGVLLLVVGVLLMKKWYGWAGIVTVVALLTQRPVIVLLAAMRGLWWLFGTQKRDRVKVLIAGGSAAIAAVILYGPLLVPQIINLVPVFFGSIDLPTVMDGFQAGGTFLTTSEYLLVNWPILLLGVSGTVLVLSTGTRRARLHGSMVALLLVWVFGQGFFFQRMMGYLDLFLLVSIGWGSSVVWGMIRRGWHRGVLIGSLSGLWLLQAMLSYGYWQQTKAPIIEAAEFTFIQEIDARIGTGVTILVPGDYYSPWIKGWTSAEVIAPGLFDNAQWGRANEGWQQYRWSVDAEQKCLAVQRDFGTKKLYVWVGSKQVRHTDMTGACFSLIRAGDDPFFALYRLDLDTQ